MNPVAGEGGPAAHVNDEVSIRDLQAKVDAWIGQFKEGYWPPLANLARLMEEVGELARELNHRHGPKKKKRDEGEADLALELADVMFVLVALANSLNVDLTDAMHKTLEKYRVRDSQRWVRKDFDGPDGALAGPDGAGGQGADLAGEAQGAESQLKP